MNGSFINILLIVFNLVFINLNDQKCYGQESEIVRVQKLFKFTGYIFPNDAKYAIPGIYTTERYTPTKKDIERVENIINQYLQENKEFKKRIGHLRRFKRQYVGYKNAEGEKIIWVNSLCGNEFKKRIKEDIVFVLDGGSCYWNVKINLEKGVLFDPIINGNS